ncbi:MAG: AfsR/SARP family transcriptional regulator, partial [Chloroflexota bacterium]
MVISHRHHRTAAGRDGPVPAPVVRASDGDAAGAAAELGIRLLGDFRVWVGERAVSETGWRLRKARSVVKLLALAPGHRLHREQLVEALWPGLAWEPAINNLKIALHVARYALEPMVGPRTGPTPPPRLLRLQGEVLSLAPDDAVWVDVEAFEAAAAEARRGGQVAAYEAAAALYTGDLLPEDRYEDWASGPREALRETYAALLLDLARLQEAAGAADAAIETLRRVVAVDAACEAARCALMRLHARAGRRAEALRQYEHLRDALRRELDAEPDPATQRLYQEIWSGASASIAPTPAAPPSNGHEPPGAGGPRAAEPPAAA